MLDRCDLSVLSLGCIASGPPHTYHSGEMHTYVDYICCDLCVASLAHSCHTNAMEDLITSDHLPFSLELCMLLVLVVLISILLMQDNQNLSRTGQGEKVT